LTADSNNWRLSSRALFSEIDAHAKRVAVIDEDGVETTYGELITRGRDLIEPLAERQLILVVCRNSMAAIAGYVALQRAGHVTLMINHKTTENALRGLIDRFRPTYAYLPQDIDHGRMGTRVGGLDEQVLVATGAEVDYELHPDLATLLPTSGSTGSPDYVRLSYRNLAANTASIIDYLGIQPGDRAITTMPMSYSYGLSIINTHLEAGATIVATERGLTERRFWQLMREAGVTTFGGVPYIYQMLKRLRFEHQEFPALRYITQAGGKLDTVMTREFAAICARKSIGFVVMYGQTEATARIAYVPPDRAESKAGAIGVAIPGGSLRLVDPDSGEPITQGEGELVYEGRNVSLGNASHRRELAHGDTRNGILFTGDIGRRDEDGFYYIVGRKSRFLKLFGNRVNLDALDQLLLTAGIEAACGGEDDGLIIYITDGTQHDRAREIIATRTELNPRWFRVVELAALPRSDNGKIQYAKLKGASSTS
jgi:acyl-coenzyme A synthetase/AMP-(fatty) acid ligase